VAGAAALLREVRVYGCVCVSVCMTGEVTWDGCPCEKRRGLLGGWVSGCRCCCYGVWLGVVGAWGSGRCVP
jgi:hypothetical protein